MINIPVISLGSPVGIGYELFLKTVQQSFFTHIPVCIGSLEVLEKVMSFFDEPFDVCVYQNSQIDKLEKEYGSLKCQFVLINIDSLIDHPLHFNKLKDLSNYLDGLVALETINLSADLVSQGYFSSVVTMAVSKKNINIFDSTFVGHTEFYQKKWNEKSVFMTFVSNDTKIVLLTTHLPLNDVSKSLNPELINRAMEISVDLMKRCNDNRKICFCGFNPHAGEQGLLGDEEQWINPLINEFNKHSSVQIEGCIPADTAFIPSNRQKYGLYICAYHDQGLIPFKMMAFDSGVNLSFGMKYIRTSVDHGTGVDLIGTLKGSNESFKSAYNLAVLLSK